MSILSCLASLQLPFLQRAIVIDSQRSHDARWVVCRTRHEFPASSSIWRLRRDFHIVRWRGDIDTKSSVREEDVGHANVIGMALLANCPKSYSSPSTSISGAGLNAAFHARELLAVYECRALRPAGRSAAGCSNQLLYRTVQ
ncbi:hypothetical protein PF005_g7506 [Phytophthora fragariae]|uniref:Uncharacterized protein n=1 Tax=Phytophthora fragariae TaxID=53985 RepID=A0A6A3YMJ6_9STRA|nr:hypothetical protein PF009_g8263 [Phytophthora fragariae]KAE9017518.1 hypothetical protein PF011_g6661 [Phytophthora fragariae]KAE9121673.1 hypothetical protein PF007_g7748 [Phytophthora fragariae]KAE9122331.1 hypothetical protein PF010_g6773 [Phytophthora fragariae]KAE9148445.1 hypothetical protein PF006_g6960 [Phytophthora fragariae]